MNLKILGIMVALLLAAGLVVIDKPSLDERLVEMSSSLSSTLEARHIHVDPAEVLEILYNSNVPLMLLDVRDESDFNLFHIVDSFLLSLDQLRDPAWVKALPQKTALILVSNDEKRAIEAWKLLMAQNVANTYILAGGINLWLELYDRESEAKMIDSTLSGDDQLKYSFEAALGARHLAADPDYKTALERTYTKKIKGLGGTIKKSGGCG